MVENSKWVEEHKDVISEIDSTLEHNREMYSCLLIISSGCNKVFR